jgi:hypothetical protein
MKTICLGLFRFLVRRAIKAAVREANKRGTVYFSWHLSRQWRAWMKREAVHAIQWAKRATPDLTLDDDLLRCAAWALESDELARDYNDGRAAAQRIDVHDGGANGGYRMGPASKAQ